MAKAKEVVTDVAKEGYDLIGDVANKTLAIGETVYNVVDGKVHVAVEHLEAALQSGFRPVAPDGDEPAAPVEDGTIIDSDHNAGSVALDEFGKPLVTSVEESAVEVPAE